VIYFTGSLQHRIDPCPSHSSGSSLTTITIIIIMLSWGKAKPVAVQPGFRSPSVDITALVTGSSGLCGARVVEMLLERGTQTVIAFDLLAPDETLQQRFAAVQKLTGLKIIVRSGSDGDLTSAAAVEAAFTGTTKSKIDIVYHIAALVGPYFDRQKYFDVNLDGTVRIIAMCKKHKVRKLVYSSSPGTRFTGADIEGLTEDELPIPDKFLAIYAETKAYGEIEVTRACCDALFTVSVAPHQIYGPHDHLFLRKLLEVLGNNRLRVFGRGGWQISMCYVDNYAHGLLCGADALYKGSSALAKFYIVTDGPPQDLWGRINEAGVYMGFTDITTKFHLPLWFMYMVATFANIAGFVLNKKFKLNYFSLRMLTMHRYFDISRAKRDLQYEPVKLFDEAWPETLRWFKENWLPQFMAGKDSKKKTA
jgi:nucleoside-diphosphate-sugar epimerase